MSNLPKVKVRNKNIKKKFLTGEGKLVNTLSNVEKANKRIFNKHRDIVIRTRYIKLKKVKGTYGTFIVKQRLFPYELRNLLFLLIIIGIFIAIL